MISEIKFLVYPDYPVDASKKLPLWVNAIEQAKKNKSTLFVLLLDENKTNSVALKLLRAGRGLGSRFLVDLDFPKLMERVGSLPFGKQVKITAFGQHCGACVQEEGLALAKYLSAKNSRVTFSFREHSGLSIKIPRGFLPYFVRRHNPRLAESFVGNELYKLGDTFPFNPSNLLKLKKEVLRAKSASDFHARAEKIMKQTGAVRRR